jgi:methionine-S-sulfoxide reductase
MKYILSTLIIIGVFMGISFSKDKSFPNIEIPEGYDSAIFAGGCFWCMEGPFESIEGVKEVYSGYTDGEIERPTYQQVGQGIGGHTEAVMVIFDPKAVSYSTLMEAYWKSFDPTDFGGQFADRGVQYRPGIYTNSVSQKEIATASKKVLEDSKRFNKPIVVPIIPASKFWTAEAYHQDYYKKNYIHYKSYRIGSGREGFLNRIWKDESK